MPTLLVGDFILVNKFTYGIRLPVLNKKVLELGEPQRGDVVVFKYPQTRVLTILRGWLVYLGDTLWYKDKTVYINGEPQKQVPQGLYTGEGSGASETGKRESREHLGEVEHSILVNTRVPDFGYGCHVLARGPITIEPGFYFAMGDNRDNSNDSRCWGLVPEKNLVGKAFAIWMSWDGNRSGFPVTWSRLGSGIK